ncbi:MAG: exodeoxyribonuclease VII small subunit [Chloroflexi bacterium]|nr:exodeoxyribonuclease VII small subunit [Chloroflexota bacterium]
MPDATPDPPAGDTDDSFEALFSRLEAITAQLEAGDLPLERSVELYAEGMRIAERCQRMLADASQRVERLREAYDEAAQNSLL